MSELYKNYDEDKMTWNEHDREFLAETVDTIYNKVAEVVITQTDRFFREQEKHKVRLDNHNAILAKYDRRIRRLEMKLLRKAALVTGGIALGMILIKLFLI